MPLSQIKHHDDRAVVSARARFENAEKSSAFVTYILLEVVALIFSVCLMTHLR